MLKAKKGLLKDRLARKPSSESKRKEEKDEILAQLANFEALTARL